MAGFCHALGLFTVFISARMIASNPDPPRGTIETGIIVSNALASSFPKVPGHKHKQLLDYLRLLFRAVNQIMSHADSNILDIQVAVTDIVILEEDMKIAYQRYDNKTMAGSIKKINEFIERNHHIFKDNDVVLYMSKVDIEQQVFGRGFETLRGLSYVGGACGKSRVALISNEEDLDIVATTTAHELLHLVGATHDGTQPPSHLPENWGSVKCRDDPNYIMATWTNQTMLPLSECTLNQVSAFLKSENGNCLSNSEPRSFPPISEAIIRTPVQAAHKFCRMYHSGAENVELIEKHSEMYNIRSCVIVCATTRTNGSRDYYVYPAPDYTYCGLSNSNVTMICINKMCVDRLPKPKFMVPYLPSGPKGHDSTKLDVDID